MSNSDPSTEDAGRWIAYLDRRMTANEAAEFERQHPSATGERERHEQFAALLHAHGAAPSLKNADFFNESVLRQITPAVRTTAMPACGLWPLWRLVAAGAACFVAVAVIYLGMVRGLGGGQHGYTAEVLAVKAGDEQIVATSFEVDGVTVVWIDGLETLPRDYLFE